jgi:hypothetical protein
MNMWDATLVQLNYELQILKIGSLQRNSVTHLVNHI